MTFRCSARLRLRLRRGRLLLASALRCASARAADAPDDLKRLSIEELLRIDVTTTARRPQPIGTTAAAISVITGDDIRRAGVTTIADALLLADGVHVARFNNGTWAISPRGFNSNTANKLLVMIDGRTVYSPLFSGTFWNMEDYVLGDIDRIEVIRGPGAALWGANAVNGVVNIITRHSRDTRGSLISVAAGREDPVIAEARYGGGADALTWRVYGKFAARDDQSFASGASSGDGRRRGQIGFRIDGGDPARSTWLLKADAFHSRDDLVDRAAGEFTELDLQGRWSVPVGGSRVDIQSYYRREYRRIPQQLTHHIDVYDVDAQQTVALGRRHEVVWGAGVRVNRDTTHASATLSFTPPDRVYPVRSVFAQDDIAVIPEQFFVTVGAKYEHNAFGGGEFQPNLRARYLMGRNQIIWGAVSRAVRRPTRFDDDIVVSGPGGVLLAVGSDDFQAESLVGGEIGYRIQPVPLFSADATVFTHHIGNLRSQELPVTGLPIVVGNTLEGDVRGVEVGINVEPTAWWRTHVGYMWLTTEIRRAPASRDIGGGTTEANDPDQFVGLRSSFDLPHRIEVDAMLRAVAALPNPAVPPYAELNLRVGWWATPRSELWIAGQDLLHDRHPEFGSPLPARVEFERSVRVGLTLRVAR
jgi:iron complex outermembrane receptor protein